jgi:hypothetical protein
MSSLYPTVHSTKYEYGLPVFEIHGNELYPTIHNELHDYGLPVFEINDLAPELRTPV